ncbi:hypothetical protein [Dechloromonas sp. A34]|uniref:hypothetical protein n=1 Tax=Dechloromonas sp. A34 TaxID=447588 RepID=UPI00224898C5|nr:hypothetical protein [Dechloromonas sp. A34]
MPARSSLVRQVAGRFLVAFLLSATLSTLVGAWVYYAANKQAAEAQQTSARDHYTNVIADLERRWGREAFNIKIRIEAQRFLEDPKQRKEQLLAYLTAQGGSIEFPSLRIEDPKGELIVSFEYADDKIPKVKFLPGQESTWALDPIHGHLFLVFRQLIWLGNENGYLLLFKPMDHALLTQYGYPHTRISLWWKGKPIASSEGEDGLVLAAKAFQQSGSSATASLLPWFGIDNNNSPQLLIESTAPPLLGIGELAGPLAISLLTFAIAVWSILGAWGFRTLRRVLALERAQNRFRTLGTADATVDRDLRTGHGIENDEITALAVALENQMRESISESRWPDSGF